MFVCTECGGTQFTFNSGYHYCTECNTQSQAIGIKLNYTLTDKPDFKEEPTKMPSIHTSTIFYFLKVLLYK